MIELINDGQELLDKQTQVSKSTYESVEKKTAAVQHKFEHYEQVLKDRQKKREVTLKSLNNIRESTSEGASSALIIPKPSQKRGDSTDKKLET
jgi:hypothetical protein